jgi:hypothetical protein
MKFTDLLRSTVFLIAGLATTLALVTVFATDAGDDPTTGLVVAIWWPLAAFAGAYLGRPERARDGVAELLTRARSARQLPAESPARIALAHLWPLALIATSAGVSAVFFPPVPAIATGYAIFVALAWRNREAAVTGIEDRDAVCFYVDYSKPLEPLKLIRTPGLRRSLSPEEHVPASPS